MAPGPSNLGMGMDSVDRQALIDAGLDPDDPQVWAVQQRISDLLVCHGIMRAVSGHSTVPEAHPVENVDALKPAARPLR